jgi:hypothetical protein
MHTCSCITRQAWLLLRANKWHAIACDGVHAGANAAGYDRLAGDHQLVSTQAACAGKLARTGMNVGRESAGYVMGNTQRNAWQAGRDVLPIT